MTDNKPLSTQDRQNQNSTPHAEMFQRQLERILASPEFQATERQRNFLQFVVVETIEGRHGEIKGYTIATRVFGRDDDFDQATDPLVSIQANQLRRALERYYLVAGKQDPVRIDIPKGTYVPVFYKQTGIEEDLAAGGKVSDMTFSDSCPSVLIRPFENLTGDPEKDFMGMGFATELVVEIASFQEVNVTFPTGEQKAAPDSNSRFVINGYIYEDSSGIKVTVHLTDTKTGKQIWGETIRTDVGAKNLLTFQGKVAREIAAKTTGEFGVISKAMVAESKNKPLQELNTYEAMLQYQEFDQNPSAENFMRAMEALKAAANADPGCGLVWGLLARLHALIYSLEIPGFEDPLEKAIEFAEEGVRISPNSQKTVGSLAFVHFFCNELSLALREVNRAIELNPNSLIFLDALGYIMTLSGEWERGTALLKRVIRLNPYYRPSVHYALWLDCVRQKDYERAYLETMGLKSPAIFWYPLAKAATFGLLGRIEEGEKSAKKLLELKPDFPSKGRVLIGHYIKFEEIAERVLKGLSKVGLRIE